MVLNVDVTKSFRTKANSSGSSTYMGTVYSGSNAVSQIFGNSCSVVADGKSSLVSYAKKLTKSTSANDALKKLNNSSLDTAVDKRVSLNVCPKNNNTGFSTFRNRIEYILGSRYQRLSGSAKKSIYGFLYNHCQSSGGLILPYTPGIGYSQQVNYDSPDVFHSNYKFNYYKNTSTPVITLSKVEFTADTPKNALHMLAAIWFFMACCKSDFGYKAEERGKAGLPPPTLYLNGFNKLYDNIPVVITSVSYNIDSEKHYVNLLIDLSKNGGQITDNVSVSSSNATSSGLANASSNGSILSFWLPTDLSFTINLAVQPNPLRVQHLFDLNDYKTGKLFLENTNSYKLVQDTGNKLVTLDCGEKVEVDEDTYFEAKKELVKSMVYNTTAIGEDIKNTTEYKQMDTLNNATDVIKTSTINFGKYKTGWLW